MIFIRIYYAVRGGHVHTRWFAGKNPRGAFGKCGELTFTTEEFEQLRVMVKQAQIDFIDDDGRGPGRAAIDDGGTNAIQLREDARQ